VRLFKAVGFIAVSLVLVASCKDVARTDVIDPTKNLNKEDFRRAGEVGYMRPGAAMGNEPPIPPLKIEKPEISLKAQRAGEPPIPDLAEIIAAPQPPKIGTTKMVSISVTDDVPLKDILIELARLADVDVEIDSSIAGGITFRAKDRPFNEVIDRIADMAGLRYTMRNNVLRIERDVPYIQTYALDMLNIDRAATGNISTSGSGSGGSSGGGGGGASSGTSSSSISASSAGDFWSKFQESVGKIQAYKPKSLSAGGATGGGSDSFFSLNRQAGTLTFSGTEAQHQVLRKFLRAIEKNIAAQVLIEAKIVEVTLNDSYQTGIDWSKISGSSIGFNADFSSVSSVDSAISAATINILKNDILRTGVDLSVAVSLLEEFGTARALSSPRLNAMNNQQAVLSFTEDIVYFDVKIDVTDAVAGTGGSASTPAKVEVTSTPKTASAGIVLSLQPTINAESNEITLNVRPSLSKVTKFVSDPGFEIGKANAAAQLPVGSPVLATLNGVSSKIPQLEVRVLDSILKVTSGQVMVIGGLLEDSFTTNDGSIPGVSEVPYFGNLFRSVDRVKIKKELVIFIRATVVPSTGNSAPADKALYDKFIDDPRPLEF
jgi:MSHA type pilus biogenesis protein MshL